MSGLAAGDPGVAVGLEGEEAGLFQLQGGAEQGLPLGGLALGVVEVVEPLPPALGEAGALADRDAFLGHGAAGFNLGAFVLDGTFQCVVGELLDFAELASCGRGLLARDDDAGRDFVVVAVGAELAPIELGGEHGAALALLHVLDAGGDEAILVAFDRVLTLAGAAKGGMAGWAPADDTAMVDGQDQAVESGA